MSIKVICAGFGRTGTLSLKTALEILGYADCYHMHELFKQNGHAKAWLDIANGKKPNWPKLFQGYQSLADWPTAYYWREHIAFYPNAKVILTVRDPDAWYDSMSKTICIAINKAFPNGATTPQLPDNAPPSAADQITMAKILITDNIFHGRLDDRDFCITQFNQHIKDVKNTVPADDLLIFDFKEGWEPLCQFLEAEIPNEPFPRMNTKDEFVKSMSKS